MHTLCLILPDTDDPGQTQAIWQHACDAAGYGLEVFHASDPAARNLVAALDLNTFPALLHEQRIIAIGTPDAATARRILAEWQSSEQ